MQVVKISNLFTVTTDPTDRQSATSHSGGWSESFYTTLVEPALSRQWTAMAQRRASLLPNEASITGWREQIYDIQGNKLIPGTAQSGSWSYPGLPAATVNAVFDSLQINSTANGSSNVSHHFLRCMPDGVVSNGEYQPGQGYRTALTLYFSSLARSFGFVGRDLSLAAQRISSVNGATVTLVNNAVNVAAGDFIRFKKVKDDSGNPVGGNTAWEVSAVAGKVITLVVSTGQTSANPSGYLRKDALNYFTFKDWSVGRITTHKMGRPSSQYRGRKSKRRV